MKMSKGLSKSRVMANMQCPRRLWLQVYKPELAESDGGVNKRLNIGTEVGILAQKLYPDGCLVMADDLGKGISETESLLAQTRKPLFEAAFKSEGILVLADLLLREKNGWRMVEVKSSASVKPYHVTDASIQSWVAKKAGLELSSTEIAHIDTSFIYPGGNDYNGLFYYADISNEVGDNLSSVEEWIGEAKRTLSGEEPDIQPGNQCSKPFDCPFYSFCASDEPEQEEYPVEILPYHGKLADELREEGYNDIREIPAGRLSKPKHLRVWEATINDSLILDEAGRNKVRALGYPRYYIDFETIQMAIPVWVGTRPYSQIPFQWSCHIEHEDGSISHHEYLSDGKSDPRRPFIESLLRIIGEHGPVIVYNAGFERSRLKELSDYYEDLSADVTTIIERIFDLLPVARKHYYHPQMKGSWSIKAVLPTIAPELAYDDLEVADGGMAMEAFSEMMMPDITDKRHNELYKALLKYCERDTWAMVAIAHYFEGKD